MLTNPSFFASGNIYPSRFVEVANAFRVRMPLAANAKVFGISQAGVRLAPGTSLDDGYAAINDEGVTVWGPGSVCWLDIAGTVAAGANIANDSDGKGVTATSGQNVGAQALQGGVSGDKIRVFVKQMGQTA